MSKHPDSTLFCSSLKFFGSNTEKEEKHTICFNIWIELWDLQLSMYGQPGCAVISSAFSIGKIHPIVVVVKKIMEYKYLLVLINYSAEICGESCESYKIMYHA